VPNRVAGVIPATFSISQRILVDEKYGSSGSPLRSSTSDPYAASRSTIGCERRQPQTTASAKGRPVAGSQATEVSPSLSRPIAVTAAGPPTASTTSATVSATERTTSSASFEIQPGCGCVTATRR
jgi:hypothetical protein